MERDRLALAVAVAALVPSVYSASLPPLSEVREVPSDVASIAAAEKTAGLTAAAIVTAAAVVSGSGEVLVLAGGLAVAYALLYRQARKADA